MTPDALAALHKAAFMDQRPWTASEFASLMESPHVFLVAAPHSFALGRAIADEVELLTLATDPKQQRQGFGRRILAEFHNTARERGATTSFLEVAETNLPAIQLYLSEGYIQSGRRDRYYRLSSGQQVAALLMSRALTLGQQTN